MIQSKYFPRHGLSPKDYSYIHHHDVLIRIVFRKAQISVVSLIESLASTFTTSEETIIRHIKHCGLYRELPKVLTAGSYINEDDLVIIEKYYGVLPRLRKYFQRHGS